MKKIIILLFLSPFLAKAQDTTIVTNLQLKAKTIKVLAQASIATGDQSLVKAFFKWRTQFIANNPNDNANVTVDTVTTLSVVAMYYELLTMPAGYSNNEDFVNDFKTSITSKRNANTYLDRLCTAIETRYSTQFALLKSKGSDLLLGN